MPDHQVPQVCDRCRSKKIRCDGIRPCCNQCNEAGAECTVSALLSRRTKPRRYGKLEVNETNRLRAELAELRTTVRNLSQQASQPQQSSQLPSSSYPVEASLSPASVNSTSQRTSYPSMAISASIQSDAVIRHLGRLVSVGQGGSGFFAGSTTGVHFMQAVDRKYQQLANGADRFPDSLFRLHLLPHPVMLHPAVSTYPEVAISRNDITLPLSKEYYLGQVDRFFQHWNQFIPVLCQRQATHSFGSALNARFVDHRHFVSFDVPSLHQLLTVLAIAAWDGDNAEHGRSAAHYYSMASSLQHDLDANISLQTIQSSILTIIFLQLSGKHSLMNCAIGTAVRSAQALGLHRNPHRFKLCVGEQELRSRIWWCIAALEATSSITYGLPKLIRACDVDVGLPTECELDDSSVTELPMCLPGEVPRVAFFIAYCRLTTIMQHLTDLLYTTTERRDGERKIQLLDRQLHVWAHELTRISHNNDRFSRAYLRLLGHSCMILIHQPALTFDKDHPQFRKSLVASTGSALALLSILDHHKSERRLFYMQPSAIRLVFQSALLCLFFCLHNPTIDLPNASTLFSDDNLSTTDGELHTTKNAVDLAIRLLRTHFDEYTTDRLCLCDRETGEIRQVLQDAIRLLENMQSKFCWMSADVQHLGGPTHLDAPTIVAGEYDVMQWPSALWGMNQPALTEWTHDYAMETTLGDFAVIPDMENFMENQ